jgi:hypothetical protein
VVIRLVVLALLATAACTPDIQGGVYYCGPERSCPPDLACDEVTAVCVYPGQADPFACGEDGNLTEPDDSPDAAYDLGARGCGLQPTGIEGCIDQAGDVDHLEMLTSLDCDVRPFEAKIRYPVAFTEVTLEVLDAAGDLVATGEVCVELDELGQAHTCVDTSVPPDETMYLRVRLRDGAPDCDGGCGYNRYQLSVF